MYVYCPCFRAAQHFRVIIRATHTLVLCSRFFFIKIKIQMKKIKLELTQKEFSAMMQMLYNNATMIGCADYEFVIPTKKNIKIFNDMLKRNGLDNAIS